MRARKIVSIVVMFCLMAVGALMAIPAIRAEEHPAQSQPVQKMRIGVIGSGRMGGTVGRLWVQAGHEVMFASRNPDELRRMASRLGPNAYVGSPLEAARFGAVLFFATPHRAVEGLGKDLHDVIQGKIVLNASNFMF